MSIDEGLADRVREALSDRGVEWEERRMFGALVFMVEAAIALGVRRGGGLLVRCDPDEGAALLGEVGPQRARQARMGELDHWVGAALRR